MQDINLLCSAGGTHTAGTDSASILAAVVPHSAACNSKAHLINPQSVARSDP